MHEPHATELRPASPLPFGPRAFWVLALFLLELAALTILYQFFARIECMATEAETLCRGLRSLVARALSIAALVVLLFWAKPGLARRFIALGAATGRQGWLLLHLAGIGLLAVPLLLAGGADMAPDFGRFAPIWGAGAVAAGGGGLAWLIAPRHWRSLAGPDLSSILLTLGIALVLPDLADLALPLWSHWPALTAATFQAVAGLLQLTGLPVYVDAPGFILGLQDFAVHVAQQCSGVEGLALVSGFTLVYALLFRSRLHWGRYWLVVLPLGLALSWGLNVVRISALVLIGEYISPELAVNGFHSFAGTLFFTLLALGLMALVQATPWLHRAEERRQENAPLRSDWLAARILPFILFMLLSSLVAALFTDPEAGYPVKAIGMGGALLFFWPALRLQNWRPVALPLFAGLGIGLLWVWSAAPAPARQSEILQMLAGFSVVGAGLWGALRLIGTVIFVPIIEELFFRGYLLARFDKPQPLVRGAALLLSSAAFGLLHGRWLEGGLSGIAFGLLYLWRGRIADPVWAHVAANLTVAAFALLRQDWSLI